MYVFTPHGSQLMRMQLAWVLAVPQFPAQMESVGPGSVQPPKTIRQNGTEAGHDHGLPVFSPGSWIRMYQLVARRAAVGASFFSCPAHQKMDCSPGQLSSQIAAQEGFPLAPRGFMAPLSPSSQNSGPQIKISCANKHGIHQFMPAFETLPTLP